MKNANDHISSYLEEYINMQNPQFAVMITGKWGCGKTYYIKQKIQTWNDKNGYKKNSKEDTITLKPIYISINGVSCMDDIVRRIKSAVCPLLYSKGAKIAKTIIFSVLHITAKANFDVDKDGTGDDLTTLLDADSFVEIFKSSSNKITGNKILIIDDVERCKIPLDELFGFVNGIVEHSNSKVILICEEDKLINVSSTKSLSVSYSEFKEKLVGHTFEYKVEFDSIVSGFIDEFGVALSQRKPLIIDLFLASRCVNLRVIRRGLIEINRFLEQLPIAVKEYPNYEAFVNNVVAYLLIVSIEYRLGNKDIEQFQSFSFSDTSNGINQEYGLKYNSILERYGLYSSVYTIPIAHLVKFVRDGYVDSIKVLLQNCRMFQSRHLANWEKLWYRYKLSNDDFLDLLKQEQRRFYKKELSFVFEVLHLSGIFLSMEKSGLVKMKRETIVRTAKQNIANIHRHYPNDLSRLYQSNQGYEFQDADSAEMRELVEYSQGLCQEAVRIQEDDYVKSVWDKFGQDANQINLSKLFAESTPTRRCTYAMNSIFIQVSPRIIVSKILAMSNERKLDFSFFILERYNGVLYEDMKSDIPALEAISKLLKSRAKRLRLIDKQVVLRISDNIDTAVLKLSNLQQ